MLTAAIRYTGLTSRKTSRVLVTAGIQAFFGVFGRRTRMQGLASIDSIIATYCIIKM